MTPAVALARLGVRATGAARLLHAGPVSRSYRVTLAGDCDAVLRIDERAVGPFSAGGTRAAALGLDRPQEFRVLAAAAAVGLAPPPLAVGDGLLLRRYVPGADWHARRPAAAARAVAVLARLHRLPVATLPLPVRDWRSTVRRYARLAGEAGEGLLAEAEARLPDLPLVRAVPCHHDPGPRNLVGLAPVLLDWEYAAVANPLIDLAVLALGFGVTGAQIDRLIHTYREAGGQPVTGAELAIWAAFVGIVGRLWAAAVTQLSHAPPIIKFR